MTCAWLSLCLLTIWLQKGIWLETSQSWELILVQISSCAIFISRVEATTACTENTLQCEVVASCPTIKMVTWWPHIKMLLSRANKCVYICFFYNILLTIRLCFECNYQSRTLIFCSVLDLSKGDLERFLRTLLISRHLKHIYQPQQSRIPLLVLK